MSPEHTYLLNKARKYCSYQERCFADVKTKLNEWNASDKTIEKIIQTLEKEDFINEERYAIAFALGKLRNNKWGRNKIFYAMTRKQIPEIYIQMGLNEIDDEEYIHILKTVLKSKKTDEKDEFKRNNKLVKYAVQKGFQATLAWKVIRDEI
ncbi:MAG: RecX family transcriptional regulator [Bacteroidetes bacterium]|nr:RecX family transcriptional regulator [Bacteroidota bacterium]